MTASLPPPQYHWNGWAWTLDDEPVAALAAPVPAGVIVSGPNHALHAVLTVLTFWACGGWAWVWLLVAANNHKTVQAVDAYGRVIHLPLTPEQAAAQDANRKAWTWGAVTLISLLVLIFVVAVVIAP